MWAALGKGLLSAGKGLGKAAWKGTKALGKGALAGAKYVGKTALNAAKSTAKGLVDSALGAGASDKIGGFSDAVKSGFKGANSSVNKKTTEVIKKSDPKSPESQSSESQGNNQAASGGPSTVVSYKNIPPIYLKSGKKELEEFKRHNKEIEKILRGDIATDEKLGRDQLAQSTTAHKENLAQDKKEYADEVARDKKLQDKAEEQQAEAEEAEKERRDAEIAESKKGETEAKEAEEENNKDTELGGGGFLDNLIGGIGSKLSGILPMILGGVTMISKPVKKVLKFIRGGINAIKGIGSKIYKGISNVIGKIKGFFSRNDAKNKKPIKKISDKKKPWWKRAVDKVNLAVKKVASGAKKAVKAATTAVKNTAKNAVSGVKNLGKKSWEGIKTVGKKSLVGVGKLIGGRAEKLAVLLTKPKALGKLAKKMVGKLMNSIPKLAKKLGTSIVKKGAKAAARNIPILGLITGIGSAIPRFIRKDILGGALDLIGGLASTIPGVGTVIANAAMAADIARDILKEPVSDAIKTFDEADVDKLESEPEVNLSDYMGPDWSEDAPENLNDLNNEEKTKAQNLSQLSQQPVGSGYTYQSPIQSYTPYPIYNSGYSYGSGYTPQITYSSVTESGATATSGPTVGADMSSMVSPDGGTPEPGNNKLDANSLNASSQPFRYPEGNTEATNVDFNRFPHPESYKLKNFVSDFQRIYPNLKMVVTSGFRNQAYQDYLRRTQSGPVAKNSIHSEGGAIDINIFDKKTGNRLLAKTTPLAQWRDSGIPKLAAKHGLWWYGFTGKPTDSVHFEVPNANRGDKINAVTKEAAGRLIVPEKWLGKGESNSVGASVANDVTVSTGNQGSDFVKTFSKYANSNPALKATSPADIMDDINAAPDGGVSISQVNPTEHSNGVVAPGIVPPPAYLMPPNNVFSPTVTQGGTNSTTMYITQNSDLNNETML